MKIDLDMSPFLMSEFWRVAGSGSIQHLPSCGLVSTSGPSIWSQPQVGLVRPGTSGITVLALSICPPLSCLLLSRLFGPLLPVDVTTGMTISIPCFRGRSHQISLVPGRMERTHSHTKSGPPLPQCRVFGPWRT